MYIPTNYVLNNVFIIHDVLYSNNRIVIISPTTHNWDIYLGDHKARKVVCPRKHTIVYTFNNIDYEPEINVRIGDKTVALPVNVYPDLTGEIIMSTMIQNESKYIKQWINYHKQLGVDRFVVYDNNSTDTTQFLQILEEYINNGTVILIQWKYPKRFKDTGISGQTTQQNHSIYAFNSAKYIGLMDIDEYLVPQLGQDYIDCVLNTLILLHNLNIDKLGGFSIECKLFGNPDSLPEDGKKFLDIYNCQPTTCGQNSRQKMFVIPRNVIIFRIHCILLGKPCFYIPKNTLIFNHYYYLNKDPKERSSRTTHRTKAYWRNNNNYTHRDDTIKNYLPLVNE